MSSKLKSPAKTTKPAAKGGKAGATKPPGAKPPPAEAPKAPTTPAPSLPGAVEEVSKKTPSRASTPVGRSVLDKRKTSMLSLVSGVGGDDESVGFASKVSSYLSQSKDKLPPGRTPRPVPGTEPLNDSTNAPKVVKPKPAVKKVEKPTAPVKEPESRGKTIKDEEPAPQKATEPKKAKKVAGPPSQRLTGETAISRMRKEAKARAVSQSSKSEESVVGSELTLSSGLGASGKHISAAIFVQARKSGQINLTNRDLHHFPPAVFTYLNPPKSETYGAVVDMSRSPDETEQWWTFEPLRRLVMASNHIPSVPDLIGDLAHLTWLDLTDNEIEEIPDSIGNLIRLQKLLLGRNKLRCLPETLGDLIDLRVLNVAHNRLDALPDSIGSLYYLEELDVGGNCLVSLPEEMTGWRVRKLNLAHNALLTVPKAIGWLQSLEDLDLSANQLTSLPPQMGELQRLQTLQCSGNALLSIPPLPSCIALKELLLGQNQLESLPGELFEQLPSLKVLDVSENKLVEFPNSILEVGGIERLNFANNSLLHVPPELALLPTLKSLLLDGNPIRTIRPDILKRSTPALLAYLRSRISDPAKLALLEADERTLADQKANILKCADLEIGSPRASDAIASRALDLSGRSLERLPDDFVDPLSGRDIHTINLSNNRIPVYPSRLSEFSSALTTLDLGKNKLGEIPAAIGELHSLRSLVLSANFLSTLPSELAQCDHLYQLELCLNRFAEFPNVIYELKNLEVLMISSNKISGWDMEALEALTMLHTLDLTNNEIASVPPPLGRMNLRSLGLEGNPFRIPRNDILAKGAPDILSYLRSRIVE